MYHNALQEEEEEVDRITHEVEITNGSLKSTQKALQESYMEVEQVCRMLKVLHPYSHT